ncbi:MAG: preprotein translocase subunit SecG [Clostridiales bacterium]|nr:preprotein translocase subunit SecG [Clostridiales bacterium]
MSLSLLSVAGWVQDSFPIIRLVLIVLMVLVALGLIIVIMFQPSSSSGMGALTGQRDTFYSKDKSKSLESVMKKITVILGIVEGVLAVVFFVTLLIYRGA